LPPAIAHTTNHIRNILSGGFFSSLLGPLKRIHNAGTHLLGLINQVLDLSKIEAGKLELSPESVALAPLIDQVIGTARQLAEQSNSRLVVGISAH
jgi:signal transduction histidine kinase